MEKTQPREKNEMCAQEKEKEAHETKSRPACVIDVTVRVFFLLSYRKLN